jgi:hypothetical protein
MTQTKELSPITCEGHPFAEEFERRARERIPVTFWVWDEAKGEFVKEIGEPLLTRPLRTPTLEED